MFEYETDLPETKPYTCCFTGHRKLPTDKLEQIKKHIDELIDYAYSKGFVRFVCGAALGFDTLCELAVLEKKKIHPEISLVLVLPCIGHYEGWRAEDKAEYERIYAQCDECYCMAGQYTERCMQLRNRAMVNDSSMCIAYLDNYKSGTSFTFKYAKEKGLESINIAELIEGGA